MYTYINFQTYVHLAALFPNAAKLPHHDPWHGARPPLRCPPVAVLHYHIIMGVVYHLYLYIIPYLYIYIHTYVQIVS